MTKPGKANGTLAGWGFVAIQALILIALIVLPGGTDWPTSGPVRWIGAAFLIVGSGGLGDWGWVPIEASEGKAKYTIFPPRRI